MLAAAIDRLRDLPGCGVDPMVVGLVLGAGSAYAAGMIRIARSHRSDRSSAAWHRGHTVAFYCGLGVLAVALFPPVDCASEVSFTAHMAQHLLLAFVAPPLLALGRPLTLALRTLTRSSATRLARALHSPVVGALSNPVVGWALFIGVPVAVHASDLFDLALRSTGWHAFEHGIWVAAALVFWWPIVGSDPSPHPLSYPMRILSLLLAMPAMSFLALAIYSAGSPLYPTYASLPPPWGPGALSSQRDAAVLMWLAGNLGLVVAMLLVAASWKRHDDRAQRRREAAQDLASPVVAN